MYIQKLKNLNYDEIFTEKELNKINQLLVLKRDQLTCDRAREIDDVISDMFCMCLEKRKAEFKYSEPSPYPYHRKTIKSSTTEILRKQTVQRRNASQFVTVVRLDDCVGDVNRIKSYLIRTNQSELLKLFANIVEHIVCGEHFTTTQDRMNVTLLCKQLGISRKTYYKHFKALRRIYEGEQGS